jgi:hypothetical protein
MSVSMAWGWLARGPITVGLEPLYDLYGFYAIQTILIPAVSS